MYFLKMIQLTCVSYTHPSETSTYCDDQTCFYFFTPWFAFTIMHRSEQTEKYQNVEAREWGNNFLSNYNCCFVQYKATVFNSQAMTQVAIHKPQKSIEAQLARVSHSDSSGITSKFACHRVQHQEPGQQQFCSHVHVCVQQRMFVH